MLPTAFSPDLPRYALALGLGLISGIVASWAGLPLPWMLGPMIGCTIAALSQAPIKGPIGLRPVVIPIIGVMLGAGFHPGLTDHLSSWIIPLVLLVPFIVIATRVSYVFYRRIGGYDPMTAFFSATPGGLNEMIMMGGEAGGDERKIALAHALRILLVISMTVLFYGFVLGATAEGSGRPHMAFEDLELWEAVVLLACAVLGVPLARALKLPAANMLGPMILSAVVHLTGWVTVPPPTLLVIAAQVCIGTIIGCRFVGSTLREIGRDMALALGATSIMLVVAVAFAALVTALTGIALPQAFLAFSPGGLTEMSLLALAMGEDVAFVSLTHIARISLIIFAVPLLFPSLAPRLHRDSG